MVADALASSRREITAISAGGHAARTGRPCGRPGDWPAQADPVGQDGPLTVHRPARMLPFRIYFDLVGTSRVSAIELQRRPGVEARTPVNGRPVLHRPSTCSARYLARGFVAVSPASATTAVVSARGFLGESAMFTCPRDPGLTSRSSPPTRARVWPGATGSPLHSMS